MFDLRLVPRDNNLPTSSPLFVTLAKYILMEILLLWLHYCKRHSAPLIQRNTKHSKFKIQLHETWIIKLDHNQNLNGSPGFMT